MIRNYLFSEEEERKKEKIGDKKKIIARARVNKNHGTRATHERLDVLFARKPSNFTSLGFDFSISSGVVTHAIRAARDYFTAGRKGIAL